MKQDRQSGERVTMADGAGGAAMRALIEDLFLPLGDDGARADGEIGLSAMDDGAALRVGDRWLVVATDSHVIQPVFFPGGDIGRLAVAGTVNDLAVMGATEPLALTFAVIVEEGFERSALERICDSIASTCRESGVAIVTGDTKVMGRGEIDGIVLNTTGVGLCDRVVPDCGLRSGDRLIITGTVGDHGLAVLSARKALGLESELCSDVAPIASLVRAAIAAGGEAITAMKDPTRGGLASALHEMASKSKVGVLLDEQAMPLSDAVRGAAELLGIDPLHVANEGKAVVGVRPEAAETVLEALRAHPLGRDAAIVGTVVPERSPTVVVETAFGKRLLTEREGEPLPRIC